MGRRELGFWLGEREEAREGRKLGFFFSWVGGFAWGEKIHFGG